MKENVIKHLKKLFLWTVVYDKMLVLKKIGEYLPISDIQILNEKTVILNFGYYNDVEVVIELEFVWDNGKLIDIK